MFCPQCGRPQANGAAYCSDCGFRLNRAAAIADGPAAYVTPPAQTEVGLPAGNEHFGPIGNGYQPAPPGKRRLPWVLVGAIASVLVVAIAGSAFFLLRSGSDGSGVAVANFSGAPSIKWKHSVAELFPSLGCTSDDSSTDSDSSNCYGSVVGEDADNLYVSATSAGDSNALAGVSKQTGTVVWSKPADGYVNCALDGATLWCSVVKYSSDAETSDSTLWTLNAADGYQTSSTSAPGEALSIAGAIDGAGYASSGSSGSDFALTKYDENGKQLWRTSVPSGAASDSPQGVGDLILLDGVVYLASYHIGADDDDAVGSTSRPGLGFKVEDGSVVSVASGTADSVFNGQLVSASADGASIGGQFVTSGSVVSPDSVDGDTPPLFTVPKSTSGSSSSRVEVRESESPYAVKHTLDGWLQADCSGTIFTTESSSDGSSSKYLVRAYAADEGTLRWEKTLSDSPSLRCSGDNVVMVSSDSATAFSVADGTQAWSVGVPSDLYPVSEKSGDGIILGRYVGDGGSMASLAYLAS